MYTHCHFGDSFHILQFKIILYNTLENVYLYKYIYIRIYKGKFWLLFSLCCLIRPTHPSHAITVAILQCAIRGFISIYRLYIEKSIYHITIFTYCCLYIFFYFLPMQYYILFLVYLNIHIHLYFLMYISNIV